MLSEIINNTEENTVNNTEENTVNNTEENTEENQNIIPNINYVMRPAINQFIDQMNERIEEENLQEAIYRSMNDVD